MAQFEDIDFPGWEVIRKIGEGSFGGVYEIHRTLPGGRVEKCALKKLTVPKDNGEIRELYSQSFSRENITAHYKDQMSELVNEYSLAQELNGCKNVVACHDVKCVQHDDGIGWDIYIRMELLHPLKQVLGAEYRERVVLRLGLDMCNALLACQEHSIIHRDIKPENILVSEKGEFKLGDFGIAKVSEKTATGTMTGTMGYMAPEVANRWHYGAQADIYSLGMVLYWMMNQRTLPFLPYPPAIPTAVQRQEAANWRFAGESFPPPVNGSRELKAIVMKACAFSTEDRYQTVRELRRELYLCYRQRTGLSQEPPVMTPAALLPDEPSQRSIVGAFGSIRGDKDAQANTTSRSGRFAALPEKKKHPRKKSFKWIAFFALLLCGGVLAATLAAEASHASKYRAAQQLMSAGEYLAAAQAFEALGNYGDSVSKAQGAFWKQEMEEKKQAYQSAQQLLDEEDYPGAAEAFEALGDYSDSAEKAQEARQLQETMEKEYQSAYVVDSTDAVAPTETSVMVSTEEAFVQPSAPPESELFSRADYLQVGDGENLFSILPGSFVFSSGAGGWETQLNIYEDGSFDGDFRDWNLGETGQKFSDGTCYVCDFSGAFSMPQKVSDYVYSVSIQRLNYPGDVGSEWIEDGVRYVQSEPYGLDKTQEYCIYLPGCPYSVFTEDQLTHISIREKLPQGEFCIYAKDGNSELGFWGRKGNCIFSNNYEFYHGAFKSELWPNGLFGKSNLVFWPEDGKSAINLSFDWSEDSQRTFVAEDERGSGEYDVNLYVAKDMQSVFVSVQSRRGISLEDWGGTSNGRLNATYVRIKEEDNPDIQEETYHFYLDKSEIRVGNYVYLGSFEQDNCLENGKEPIEWRVLALDRSGGKALLVSRYALTARCYHNGDTYPTWANSNIRGWLNGQFLRNAFTEQEQAVILRSRLSSPAYEGIEGGQDTWDRVFLLSRGEAADYFEGSADRRVEPTEYARVMGADTADGNGCCWWWLRTPGAYPYDAGIVYAVGGIDHTGGNVKNATIAVRPALWVELSS